LDTASLQTIGTALGTIAGFLSPFVLAFLDHRRRHSPNRVEDKASAPVRVSPVEEEFPMGVVLKTSAITAGLLQQVFEQNKVINGQLETQGQKIERLETTDRLKSKAIYEMEKEIKVLKDDNNQKTRKITTLENRVKQLEKEMRKHNLPIPEPQMDTGELRRHDE
jgi:predicted RNase H-like nuclease (RuvC/YqgF family)